MNAQYAMALEHAPSYAPEDFLRTDATDKLLHVLTSHNAWAEPCMLLVGPKGCGKTHLLHVLAAQTPSVFLTPHQAASVAGMFMANRLHIIDDAPSHDHAWVAQAINHARAANMPLLLSVHAVPRRLDGLLPDLSSRLNAMPQSHYPEAEDALFAMVMAKRFSDLQWRVAPEVVQYLVQRLPRSFAAHHAFVRHADTQAMQAGRALTLPFARELLATFEQAVADA